LKLFAVLINQLSITDESESRISAIHNYLKSFQELDAAEKAIELLLGKKIKRIISITELRSWAPEITGYPSWLIQRCEREVGSFVKTLSLLLPFGEENERQISIAEWLGMIQNLRANAKQEIIEFIMLHVAKIIPEQRTLILNLILGRSIVTLPRVEIAKAIGMLLNTQSEIITLRLQHYASSRATSLSHYLLTEIEREKGKLPAKFPKVLQIDNSKDISGFSVDLSVFGKRDGVVAQLVKCGTFFYLWTREGDLISVQFPELTKSFSDIESDFKILGQVFSSESEMDINMIMSKYRNGQVSKSDKHHLGIKFEVWQVIVGSNEDILKKIQIGNVIYFPQTISFKSIADLEKARTKCRSLGYSGLILKDKDRINYQYWPSKPLMVNAILTSVEFGGITNSSIQSMTFGLGHEEEIMPIVRISLFSKDIDLASVVEFVKQHTIERFGPVRTVRPSSVWEIQFDAIIKSPRKKSKVALVNPTLIRASILTVEQSSAFDDLRSLILQP